MIQYTRRTKNGAVHIYVAKKTENNGLSYAAETLVDDLGIMVAYNPRRWITNKLRLMIQSRGLYRTQSMYSCVPKNKIARTLLVKRFMRK